MARKSGRAKKSASGVAGLNDVVKAVAQTTGKPQTQTLETLQAFFSVVKNTTRAGIPVRISGFGKWHIGVVKARRASVFGAGGPNAKRVTKMLQESYAVRFKASGNFLTSK